MKRTTITMDGYGRVAVPSDATNVWMSEMELVRLFDVIAPTLRAAIRAVYKSEVLLLCGNVCPTDGRGTCLPYQYTQCRKGTQRPVGKAVLAKRQTNALAFVRQ